METVPPANEQTIIQPSGELPAAAVAVAKGITEAEFNQLRAERDLLAANLATTAEARKKAETDAAHLADENARLKQVTPPAVIKAAKEKSKWFYQD